MAVISPGLNDTMLFIHARSGCDAADGHSSQILCTSTYGAVYVEAEGMNRDSKTDLPQGTLDLLILQMVAHGPIHGYAIAQRILQVSQQALDVRQGSLYPALHRLEYRKLLAAEWAESETGRSAKFYRLTAAGRAHLKRETEDWRRVTQAVELILGPPRGETA